MSERFDGHKLAMTLSDEGYVVGKIICPHDGNPQYPASCAIVTVTGEPDYGCFVIENFSDIGMECFKGEVELPTIDIGWWDNGDFKEPEIWIKPAAGAKGDEREGAS